MELRLRAKLFYCDRVSGDAVHGGKVWLPDAEPDRRDQNRKQRCGQDEKRTDL